MMMVHAFPERRWNCEADDQSGFLPNRLHRTWIALSQEDVGKGKNSPTEIRTQATGNFSFGSEPWILTN